MTNSNFRFTIVCILIILSLAFAGMQSCSKDAQIQEPSKKIKPHITPDYPGRNHDTVAVKSTFPL